jgi:hypothetical protein
MKARIKKTGEIINIAEYAKVELESCDSYGIPIEYGFDEVEILQDKSDDIDWEQRRFELVKTAMLGLMAGHHTIYDAGKLPSVAINYADALIVELKKGGKQ